MKTFLLPFVLVCMYILLAIAFLSITSLADILAAGMVRKNTFTLVLDIVILLSNAVLLVEVFTIMKLEVHGSASKNYQPSES